MCTVVLLTVPLGTDLERVGTALGCAVAPVAARSGGGSSAKACSRSCASRPCDCGTQLGVRFEIQEGATSSTLERDRARLLRFEVTDEGALCGLEAGVRHLFE